MIIAFDVDDTLIVPVVATDNPGGLDTPNYEVIAIYRFFQSQGHRMIVWSGGGIDYARMWSNKLGLNPDMIIEKSKESAKAHGVDICFDDCIVDLADKNIRVKRINNKISRKEWNKHNN